jgi:hypothetical protein
MAAPVEKGKYSMSYLITPPGAFSPTKQWRDFLARMKRDLPQDDVSVKGMIRLAEGVLTERAKMPATTRRRLHRDD